MMRFQLGLSKEVMRLFASDIGATEYFSYVGNLVTVEKCIAVMAILTPDFIEREGCIFWRSNADEYDPAKFPMEGYKRDASGKLMPSDHRRDIERYRNNFTVSQFFSLWEGTPGKPVSSISLSEEDYKLCHIFAQQIERYWRVALSECFPDRSFEFEITDDLLDEYGVCLTFCQNN